MEFITIPLVVGIVTMGVYKLFELFVKKKERIMLIEKASENLDPALFQNQFQEPVKIFNRFSSGTLKVGCLLIGLGLGLLVGFTIMMVFKDFMYESVGRIDDLVYGASVLLFGGISLLVAFALEMKYANKK